MVIFNKVSCKFHEKKVHVVWDMLDEVSCYKPTEYDPEICKTLPNETIHVSFVSSKPTHKQNRTLDQSQRMSGSVIFYLFNSLYCDSVHYTAHIFWDVRFTQQWVSRLQASGLLHCVGWLMGNNFLEEIVSSIFRADDGGCRFLQNVRTCLPNYIRSQKTVV
jgi:hypothetical protein